MGTFDLLLRGGTVIDGSRAPAVVADVGVRGERIETVGNLSSATASRVLDVTGRVVAPGFVDVHAHTDLANRLSDELKDVKLAGLRQGVTTEVCGNCGKSPFPLLPAEETDEDPFLGFLPEDSRLRCDSFATYRDAMQATPLAANLAPLLGHGRVRASVMGYDARSPRPEELEQLKRRVAQAMDEGAFGLSTGLVYSPGIYATTDEIIALAAVASHYGRVYASHMRDEADSVEQAVAEALQIGQAAQVAVEISHHKIAGRRNWGRSHATLAAISDARHRGLDVTIDVYPYTAGSTRLNALLPPWVHAGGLDRLLERLTDDAVRRRIEADFSDGLPGWQNLGGLVGWENVVVAGHEDHEGRSIAELAEEAGVNEMDFVADLILDRPNVFIIIHMMEESEVASIGAQPFALVGSDGVPLPGQQHPRLAGTFTRLLRRAADQGEQALVDLIHRATCLPAEKFNLPDRGVVAAGKVADLVVFDPQTVRDHATYAEPRLPPSGVEHVMVAGKLCIEDGRDTEVRAGRVLEPG